MKKRYLFTTVTLAAFMLCACGHEEVGLTKENITTKDEIVFNVGGTIQATMIDEFDKDYYDVDELTEFINKDLETFNSEKETTIKLDFAVKKSNKVYTVFDFGGSSDFESYTGAKTEVLDSSAAKKSDLVPDSLEKYGKSKTKKKDKVIKSKYKTAVIDLSGCEIYDKDINVTVAGDIEFSSNVKKVDDNTATISSKDKVGVIVYKPY
ncbi:MAG: hypothetical protein K6G26_11350 [Lachnospiraceae bacterium]|nr:hypothetical protein [Lachnospiraceae bacterium]